MSIDRDTDHGAVVEARPWGPWATAGLSVVVAVVYLVTAVVIGVAIVIAELAVHPGQDPSRLAESLEQSGLLLATGAIGTAVVCGSLVLLFAWMRRGISVAQYLGFRPVRALSLLAWLLGIAAFALATDALTLGLGKPLVPEFMVVAYETAGFLPLFWLGIVVAAPAFEELFFRGFLLEGLHNSRLGAAGAVVLTSGLWAVVHVQYGSYERGIIFALGILLGIARIQTRSIWTAIAMHAMVNLMATVEAAIVCGG